MSGENKPRTAEECATALIELEDSKGGVVSDSDLIPFFQNILDTARNEGRIELEQQHEKAILQVIDERDAAEQAISQAYYLVIGQSPEWSNNFGHSHALEEIEGALRLLKSEIKDAKVDHEYNGMMRAANIIRKEIESCPGFFNSLESCDSCTAKTNSREAILTAAAKLKEGV